MKIVTQIGPGNGTDTWNAPIQRTTIIDGTNPKFFRLLMLSNDGVRVTRGTIQVGFKTSDLIAAAVALEPSLSWAPQITTQPVDLTVTAPNGAGFTVTALSETTLSYQWQNSTNGTTWTSLTDTGVYTGSNTQALAISNSTGLNNNEYRCIVTNASGSTTTVAATLTVS